MKALTIKIAEAKTASQEAVSRRHQDGEEPSRWDMVPAAIAAQISEQIGNTVIVEGIDETTLRVMQCDAEGNILPPSKKGRDVFKAIAETLAGTPYGVRFEALNESWNHLEVAPEGKTYALTINGEVIESSGSPGEFCRCEAASKEEFLASMRWQEILHVSCLQGREDKLRRRIEDLLRKSPIFLSLVAKQAIEESWVIWEPPAPTDLT